MTPEQLEAIAQSIASHLEKATELSGSAEVVPDHPNGVDLLLDWDGVDIALSVTPI